jgi:hypothetical protein
VNFIRPDHRTTSFQALLAKTCQKDRQPEPLRLPAVAECKSVEDVLAGIRQVQSALQRRDLALILAPELDYDGRRGKMAVNALQRYIEELPGLLVLGDHVLRRNLVMQSFSCEHGEETLASGTWLIGLDREFNIITWMTLAARTPAIFGHGKGSPTEPADDSPPVA